MIYRITAALAAMALIGCLQADPKTAKTPASGAGAATTSAHTSATSSAPTATPKTLKILQQLEEAGVKHPRIAADVDFTVMNLEAGDKRGRTGKVYYQGKTKTSRQKFRVAFKTLQQDDGPLRSREVDYAFSGEFVTIRKAKIKHITRYQIPPEQQDTPLRLGKGPFPMPFGQKVADVLKHFRVITRPPKKGDPKDTAYLKLVTRPSAAGAIDVAWIEMWVSRTTGLPVKIITEKKNGNLTTVIFTKIKTPKKIADKVFDLPDPGPGWKVRVVPLKNQRPRPRP